MTYLHGAIHEPQNPSVETALPFLRAGSAAPPNWFEAWDWRPDDGDILDNDRLGCCVPVGVMRLVQAFKARSGIKWKIPLELVHLRYEATGGWLRTPETDRGTVTQADRFDWSISPVIADGAYPVTWTIVEPADTLAALRHGPLLVTLGLDAATEDDPLAWGGALSGPPVSLHQVVVGATTRGKLMCGTYGMIVAVDLSRVVAVDLMEMAA